MKRITFSVRCLTQAARSSSAQRSRCRCASSRARSANRRHSPKASTSARELKSLALISSDLRPTCCCLFLRISRCCALRCRVPSCFCRSSRTSLSCAVQSFQLVKKAWTSARELPSRKRWNAAIVFSLTLERSSWMRCWIVCSSSCMRAARSCAPPMRRHRSTVFTTHASLCLLNSAASTLASIAAWRMICCVIASGLGTRSSPRSRSTSPSSTAFRTVRAELVMPSRCLERLPKRSLSSTGIRAAAACTASCSGPPARRTTSSCDRLMPFSASSSSAAATARGRCQLLPSDVRTRPDCHSSRCRWSRPAVHSGEGRLPPGLC
mmetsp:Transcript_46908/g.121450  ORF Transcript_46908/g.121450 Transcript_46908/m.121450 type:complete len:323 (-) Transcript_46908:32-1000(-)